MQSGKRGRPIAHPPWSLAHTIEALQAALSRRPADVPIHAGRAALAHLEQMQAQQAERYDLLHIKDLYSDLVREHNEIWEAARAHGVEVFQTFGSDVWTWDNGERRGIAATPAQALIAAMDDKAVIV